MPHQPDHTSLIAEIQMGVGQLVLQETIKSEIAISTYEHIWAHMKTYEYSGQVNKVLIRCTYRMYCQRGLLGYELAFTDLFKTWKEGNKRLLDELLLRVDHVEQPLRVHLLAGGKDDHFEQLRDRCQEQVQVRPLADVHLLTSKDRKESGTVRYNGKHTQGGSALKHTASFITRYKV